MVDTFRFRQFKVYQDAKIFRKLVVEMLNKFQIERKFALLNQIDRASISIVLNIAEGSAKKSDKEFARFLEISIASANEVVAAFDIAQDDRIITQKDFDLIEREAANVVKQLGGFKKTLLRSTRVNC
ncbi:four helix bundle protein [Patescibacteria group bacterium]|nr:four helix bundle protein [Patescibacteria group bacterium]